MAMAPPSPSPPSSSFIFPNNNLNRPSSPTKSDSGSGSHSKPDLKPNAHPYPIKTTSTAALARSNSSSSASPAAARHHYVPVPPSPQREHSGSGGRREEYRGHRYSRSFSSSEDLYSNGSTSSLHEGPRALPIPPNVSNNSIAAMKAAAAQAQAQGNSNNVSPRRWTPEQLAVHLGNAVSPEAGEWAARSGVGGRAFMRMGDDDLAALGAPPSLRPAANALRQEVLDNSRLNSASPVSSGSERSGSASPTRMRYGAYEVEEPEDVEEDDNTPSKRSRARAHAPVKPSASPHIHASASPFFVPPSPTADDERVSRGERERERFRNGRVQGMVRSFESSGSESEGSPERERKSGFRTVNGRSGPPSASASDGDGMGTMRPLPARPDGLASGMLVSDDTGATVRAGPGAPLNASAALSLSEEELTVEELLARGDGDGAGYGINGTGSPGGSWRKKGRRSRKADADGDDSPSQVPQGSSRPLPAEPRKRRYMTPPTGGVHAWEAEQEEEGGLAKSTMKWVPSVVSNANPKAENVFAAAAVPNSNSDSTPAIPAIPATPATPTSPTQDHSAAKRREEEAAARGRARGEEIRAQLAKIKSVQEREREELERVVEGFRRRLEEVERRVGDMEGREREREVGDKMKETGDKKETLKETQKETQKEMSITQRLDPRRLLALFTTGTSSTTTAGSNNTQVPVGPTTIAGIPSYVLLVSLGMCAVVLRVLVRRGLAVAGRKTQV
ncbi:hypothetical protein C8F01DRAFT_1262302 [Mycena amicta]|nr:hypothetical protein C8F01DRAFT_1262302 [Mycena amicta]